MRDPTHNKGHILDVVISSHQIVNPKSVTVDSHTSEMFTNCDHFPVTFSLTKTAASNLNKKKVITFRNVKEIDTKCFADNLAEELVTVMDPEGPSQGEMLSFESRISLYNSKCLTVLDNHAPLLTKEIKERKSAPWFDGEYKALRSQRRKSERKWKISRSLTDKKHYESIREQCTELSDRKKHEFFKAEFIKHSYSSKSLFRFVDTFLDRDKSIVLPSSESLKDTVENFNIYFQEKIKAIRNNFDHVDSDDQLPSYCGEKLAEFSPTTIEELEEIIKASEIKSSSIDPLPANIFKENLEVLLPVLVDIVNASLSSGSIDGAKLAHITPLIKGQGLDSDNLKNYRPISNLSFVGKMIERVVLRRLNEHLEKNNLDIPQQSG